MNRKTYLMLIPALCLMILTTGVSAAQPILPDKFYGSVKLGGMNAPIGTKIDVKLAGNYLKTYELENVGEYILYVAEGDMGDTIEFFIQGMPVGDSVRTGGLRKNLNLSLSPTDSLSQNFTSQNKTIDFQGKDTVSLDMEIKTNEEVSDEGISVTLYEDGALAGFSLGDGKAHIKSLTVDIDSSIVDYAIIKIYYTAGEINNFNVNLLRIYFYNESIGEWEEVPEQGINTQENYVWAKVTHFSSYGLFGNELFCGDGICSSGIGESCSSCPVDCGTCPSGGGVSGGYITCEEKWVCTDWSVCSEGIQTRTCVDENECNTFVNKPSESQSCEEDGIQQITPLTPIELSCGNGKCNEGETCESCPEDCGECPAETEGAGITGMFTGLQGAVILGLVILVVLAILLFTAKRRKTKKGQYSLM